MEINASVHAGARLPLRFRVRGHHRNEILDGDLQFETLTVDPAIGSFYQEDGEGFVLFSPAPAEGDIASTATLEYAWDGEWPGLDEGTKTVRAKVSALLHIKVKDDESLAAEAVDVIFTCDSFEVREAIHDQEQTLENRPEYIGEFRGSNWLESITANFHPRYEAHWHFRNQRPASAATLEFVFRKADPRGLSPLRGAYKAWFEARHASIRNTGAFPA